MEGNRKGIIVKGRSGDPESVYDTFTYDHTKSSVSNYFQNFSGRTLDETNMTDSGKLPTGKSLMVNAFNIYLFIPSLFTNAKMLKLYEFLAKTSVEFIKENRAPSFTRTLQMLMGISFLGLIVPTAAGDNVPIIAPWFRGQWKIVTRALDLGANQTFYARQTINTAALDADLNGVKVKIEAAGLMSKRITE